jgi:hypothetical protein
MGSLWKPRKSKIRVLFLLSFTAGVCVSCVFGISSRSLADFITCAPYFTGGRGVFHTAYTILLFAIIGIPLYGLFTEDKDIVSIYVFTRSKSKSKWYCSQCLKLLVYSFQAILWYLIPLFITVFIISKEDISLFLVFVLFGNIYLLMALFFFITLLLINILSVILPIAVSIVLVFVCLFILGYFPMDVSSVFCTLNPLWHLFFDLHRLTWLPLGMVFHRTSEIAVMTPLFSILYFSVISILLIVVGFPLVNNSEMSRKRR